MVLPLLPDVTVIKPMRVKKTRCKSCSDPKVCFVCVYFICFFCAGVVTFCKKAFCPVASEEGLTEVLATDRENAVGCYAEQLVDRFTRTELLDLDSEGIYLIGEDVQQTTLEEIFLWCFSVDNYFLLSSAEEFVVSELLAVPLSTPL